MSSNVFAPVDKIHQALHAYHAVADDRGDVVSAVHFCSCNPDMDQFQCLIYDSTEPGAKLIGIEYMLSQAKFEQLPDDEKPYWHSHEYEVMSGSLVIIGVRVGSSLAETAASTLKVAEEFAKKATGYTPAGGAVPDAAELKVLNMIRKLYGKTIHTWHPPSSDFPIGPPRLMMPTDPQFGGTPKKLLDERDHIYGINTDEKKAQRQEHMTEKVTIHDKVDQYKQSGKVPQFQTVERDVKPAPSAHSHS